MKEYIFDLAPLRNEQERLDLIGHTNSMMREGWTLRSATPIVQENALLVFVILEKETSCA